MRASKVNRAVACVPAHCAGDKLSAARRVRRQLGTADEAEQLRGEVDVPQEQDLCRGAAGCGRQERWTCRRSGTCVAVRPGAGVRRGGRAAGAVLVSRCGQVRAPGEVDVPQERYLCRGAAGCRRQERWTCRTSGTCVAVRPGAGARRGGRAARAVLVSRALATSEPRLEQGSHAFLEALNQRWAHVR